MAEPEIGRNPKTESSQGHRDQISGEGASTGEAVRTPSVTGGSNGDSSRQERVSPEEPGGTQGRGKG